MPRDILPEKNEDYSSKEYWDNRYVKEEEDADFEWFKSYKDLAGIFHDIIPDKSARILMLGCGNSRLSEDMWEDGYKSIVNVDYSGVLIEKMKRRHIQSRPEMQWHEMDVRNLKFEDGCFNVAIDKGTMDAMMTAKGDVWVNQQDPPEQVITDCNQEVNEVLRVLREGGTFIYLTFGQPHFRRQYLTRPNTTLEVRELGETFHYYLYILRKQISTK